jgi:hypothetical protein
VGIYGCYGRDARKNFRNGSFDWKLKVLVQFLKVKRGWRATSPPPPLFPKMHPIKRRCKLCPGRISGCYGRNARKNFKEGSFDWKLKVLVQLLKVKRDWRQLTPFPMPLFPKMHPIKILR